MPTTRRYVRNGARCLSTREARRPGGLETVNREPDSHGGSFLYRTG